MICPYCSFEMNTSVCARISPNKHVFINTEFSSSIAIYSDADKLIFEVSECNNRVKLVSFVAEEISVIYLGLNIEQTINKVKGLIAFI